MKTLGFLAMMAGLILVSVPVPATALEIRLGRDGSAKRSRWRQRSRCEAPRLSGRWQTERPISSASRNRRRK